MLFKKIVKLFKNGNVCVTGLRGTGKDLLMGNVIARRKCEYISNLNYGGIFTPLCLSKLDILNNYSNFINNKIVKYNYPYNSNVDIYISDCGVYFPSQYCNKLNNTYEGLISFQALSRQIAKSNVHINAQNLNRVWDKIREQSDTYIRCVRCFVIFGFVFQKIVIYDKYQSCLDRINPCRIYKPLFCNKDRKLQINLYLDNFYNTHGVVKSRFLIYKNKSKHNTYYFGDLLKGGE